MECLRPQYGCAWGRRACSLTQQIFVTTSLQGRLNRGGYEEGEEDRSFLSLAHVKPLGSPGKKGQILSKTTFKCVPVRTKLGLRFGELSSETALQRPPQKCSWPETLGSIVKTPSDYRGDA